MKIGIISDTHGKTRKLRAAMELLVRLGVEAVVHCGDIVSAKCVELLGAYGVPAYLAIGNMDRHVEELRSAAQRAGVQFGGDVAEVPIGGERYLVATHGDDEDLLDTLVTGEQFPYVCHGHTHSRRDERIGPVRVINPGALYHPKHPHRPTVAVLDTQTDSLETVELR
jgi:putative phosphoesterase